MLPIPFPQSPTPPPPPPPPPPPTPAPPFLVACSFPEYCAALQKKKIRFVQVPTRLEILLPSLPSLTRRVPTLSSPPAPPPLPTPLLQLVCRQQKVGCEPVAILTKNTHKLKIVLACWKELPYTCTYSKICHGFPNSISGPLNYSNCVLVYPLRSWKFMNNILYLNIIRWSIVILQDVSGIRNPFSNVNWSEVVLTLQTQAWFAEIQI